jgi:hypothetical protein
MFMIAVRGNSRHRFMPPYGYGYNLWRWSFMIVMKVRYEIGDIHLKASNMSPKDADSYVLLKASDDSGNEIFFALSNSQADRLEAELYEANRRRRYNAATASTGEQEQNLDLPATSETFAADDDQLAEDQISH